MKSTFTEYADPSARIMMALIFILSGIGKIGTIEGTTAYMEAFGLPGVLLMPTIAFEIIAGILLASGFKTRIVAQLLAVFTIVSAIVFHRDFADQVQQIMFLKNVAIAGGLLVFLNNVPNRYSVDAAIVKG